jgi:hypothetical protein
MPYVRCEDLHRFSEQGIHYCFCFEHTYVISSPDGIVRVAAPSPERHEDDDIDDERRLVGGR